MKVLRPPWRKNPENVTAFVTTRQGGFSAGQYSSFNLATHVGDDPDLVARNRRLLIQEQHLPALPIWLNQVHGNAVIDASDVEGMRSDGTARLPEADAIISRHVNQVLAIQIADCLPVLLLGDGQIGAIHAGWRGLASGVIAETRHRMEVSDIIAWLGPSIGPCHYEVDAVVHNALADYPDHFIAGAVGHWQLDMKGVARQQLAECGVTDIVESSTCTACDESLFSFRGAGEGAGEGAGGRVGECGRMAMLAWMK